MCKVKWDFKNSFPQQECQKDRLHFSLKVGILALSLHINNVHLKHYFCELCPVVNIERQKTKQQTNKKTSEKNSIEN